MAQKYIVEGRLGAGRYGIVYAATHRVTRANVALKILHPALAEDRAAVTRFLREAQAAARITHPNVAEVRDAGEHEVGLYLVMPLVRGESLKARLEKGKPTPHAVARIGAEIADGASAAHAVGVIHRDLKPANVMMEQGRARIIDFGVSKLVTSDDVPRLTASGVTLGTPHYAAPEQLGDAKHVDERADVYSIGAIVYEMLTGRPPHHEARSLSDLVIRSRTELPDLAAERPDIPPELTEVTMRALAYEREQRQPSARVLATELRSSVGLERPRDDVSPGRWVAGGAFATLLIAGAIAVMATRPADPPPPRIERAIVERPPPPEVLSTEAETPEPPPPEPPTAEDEPERSAPATAVTVQPRSRRRPISRVLEAPPPPEAATRVEPPGPMIRTRRLSNDEF